MKKILIIISGLIFLVNIPPIKSLFEVFFGRVQYYTTEQHGFSDSDYAFKGRTFDEVWDNFSRYKRECGKPEIVLYRTFQMHPYKVWLWGEYLFSRKYRLPYMNVPGDYDYKNLSQHCE